MRYGKLASDIFHDSNEERIKFGEPVKCSKENETCKNRQCPHKGEHEFFADCRVKTCKSDNNEKCVECRRVKNDG
jgi:hypothetical protein